jgi:hypothetical protein
MSEHAVDVLARLAVLEREIADLRKHSTPTATAEEPRLQETAVSRRGLLKHMGGAVAAGAVAAGAGTLLLPRAAAATTGQPVLLGGDSSPTLATDATTVTDPSGTALSPLLVSVRNWSNGPENHTPTGTRVALAGISSGADSTTQPRFGVWGAVDTTTKGAGVVGRGGASGPSPVTIVATAGQVGVIGTATDNGRGVIGAANGTLAYGVFGTSDAGSAVVGDSGGGVDLVAGGSGRILQQPRVVPGPPTIGTYNQGEQIRDANGQLWICIASSDDGGIWRRAATVKEGFTGGSINYLASPIRIFDTRDNTGGAGTTPLASGGSKDVTVAPVTKGSVTIPSDAVAVIGNLAVTGTGNGGYLTLYPVGSPPPAGSETASINWFGANQNINNGVTVALTGGKFTVKNGIIGGSTATHVVFDAVAFVV